MNTVPTFEEAVFTWLGRRRKEDPARYSGLQIYAEEGGGYSEYTMWDFSCDLHFFCDGKRAAYSMSEKEVAEFLNEVWKTEAESERGAEGAASGMRIRSASLISPPRSETADINVRAAGPLPPTAARTYSEGGGPHINDMGCQPSPSGGM